MARDKLGSWHGLYEARLEVAREDGTFHLTCPGLRNPLEDAVPTEVVVFDPPGLDRHAGQATVLYTMLSYNHHWDVHRVTGRQVQSCRLELDGEAWRVVACEEVLSVPAED